VVTRWRFNADSSGKIIKCAIPARARALVLFDFAFLRASVRCNTANSVGRAISPLQFPSGGSPPPPLSFLLSISGRRSLRVQISRLALFRGFFYDDSRSFGMARYNLRYARGCIFRIIYKRVPIVKLGGARENPWMQKRRSEAATDRPIRVRSICSAVFAGRRHLLPLRLRRLSLSPVLRIINCKPVREMIQYIDTSRCERATNSRRKIPRIRIGSYPLTARWKWNGGIPLSRMIYHCNA